MPPRKKRKINPQPSGVEGGQEKSHTCRKVSFYKAANEQYKEKILLFIEKVHQLASHGTLFVKYYFTKYFQVNQQIPVVDGYFVEATLYLLNKGAAWKPKNAEKQRWKEVLIPYVSEYNNLVQFTSALSKFDHQPINYLVTAIVTNMKVNVQENFTKMLFRFINFRLRLKENKGKPELAQLLRNAKSLKNWIYGDNMADEAEPIGVDSTLIDDLKSLNIPFSEDRNVAYRLRQDPMSFLPSYCLLSLKFEENGYSLFNALPLRKSVIQSHVIIDFQILCDNIIGITKKEVDSLPDKKILWSRVFRTGTKAFKPTAGMEYTSVATDGVALSVHLANPNAKRSFKSKAESKAALRATYVERNLESCEGKKIVVIDPNKRDLLYCQDENKKIFRYTSTQRNVETGRKNFRIWLREFTPEALSQIQTNIPSCKTMNYDGYCDYLRYMKQNWNELEAFYSNPVHRQMRFNTYRNTQRSEMKLIKNMKKTYGNDFVVVMGDWSDAGHTMKYQKPSKTKGWRTVFAQHKIKCYLLDEHLTSSVCPKCMSKEYIVKGFKERLNPRPWQRHKKKMVKVHGLLGCKNPQCIEQVDGMRYWNRDTLSTCNMLQIVKSLLDGNGRPNPFKRTSNDLSDIASTIAVPTNGSGGMSL